MNSFAISVVDASNALEEIDPRPPAFGDPIVAIPELRVSLNLLLPVFHVFTIGVIRHEASIVFKLH
jgi:hypothetical protein